MKSGKVHFTIVGSLRSKNCFPRPHLIEIQIIKVKSGSKKSEKSQDRDSHREIFKALKDLFNLQAHDFFSYDL